MTYRYFHLKANKLMQSDLSMIAALRINEFVDCVCFSPARREGFLVTKVASSVKHVYKKVHLPVSIQLFPNVTRTTIDSILLQSNTIGHGNLEGCRLGRLPMDPKDPLSPHKDLISNLTSCLRLSGTDIFVVNGWEKYGSDVVEACISRELARHKKIGKASDPNQPDSFHTIGFGSDYLSSPLRDHPVLCIMHYIPNHQHEAQVLQLLKSGYRFHHKDDHRIPGQVKLFILHKGKIELPHQILQRYKCIYYNVSDGTHQKIV